MRSHGCLDLSLSSVFHAHFKCPGKPGLTRKRHVVIIIIIAAGCVVMIMTVMIIAAGDAGDV